MPQATTRALGAIRTRKSRRRALLHSLSIRRSQRATRRLQLAAVPSSLDDAPPLNTQTETRPIIVHLTLAVSV